MDWIDINEQVPKVMDEIIVIDMSNDCPGKTLRGILVTNSTHFVSKGCRKIGEDEQTVVCTHWMLANLPNFPNRSRETKFCLPDDLREALEIILEPSYPGSNPSCRLEELRKLGKSHRICKKYLDK